MTLSDAKKFIAKFSGPLAAPPRSIVDILSLATTVEYSEANCMSFALRSLEDVKTTIEAIPASSNGKLAHRGRHASANASEQFYQGNTRIGIEMMHLAIDQYPYGDYTHEGHGRSVAQLASFYAHTGEFDQSDKYVVEAKLLQARADDLWRTKDFNAWSGPEIALEILDFHIAESEATVAASKGELILAEALYRKALTIAEDNRLSFDGRYEFAELALARTLTRQGRLLESESMLRERLKDRLPSATPLVAATFLRLSENLYEQGRFVDAERSAHATIDMFRGLCTAPSSLLWAEARDILAKALIGQERWKEGLTIYDELRTALSDTPSVFERKFSGSVSRALALLKSGDAIQAAIGLTIALERSESQLGADHYRSAEIRGFLAMAQSTNGDTQNASENFERSVAALVAAAQSANASGDTLKARNQRLRYILEAYMKFLVGQRTADSNATDEVSQTVFRLTELARSRSVQRALTASGSRVSLNDPTLARLARQEQDTKKRIAAVYGSLENELSRPAAVKSGPRIEVLRNTISGLKAARAALLSEIERHFPTYSELIRPKPVDIADVQGLLRTGEALIATYVGETQTYVWAIPNNGPAKFNVAPIGRDNLEAAVSLLRAALDPGVTDLGEIPVFNTLIAHELYSEILAPIIDGWQAAKHLLVIADGPFGYLPLSVLPTKQFELRRVAGPLFSEYRDVPWLARSHAVSQIPSVGALISLRNSGADNTPGKPFIGFGDPWFGKEHSLETQAVQQATRHDNQNVSLRSIPKTRAANTAGLAALPRLPETADELRALATAMRADPAGTVFLGKDASEGNVKNMDLTDIRVLAFATHGLVPGDLNGLTQPALALSSAANGKGKEDGLLTMGEIMGLKLDADWVVLSACNTGSGDGAGAEAVSGLGQAFFYAGTKALLVSNWPVETTSAKLLTTDLFFRQAANTNLTRAEALRQSMIELMDGPGFIDPATRKAAFSYAHPLFWAPFSIVGDGSGVHHGS